MTRHTHLTFCEYACASTKIPTARTPRYKRRTCTAFPLCAPYRVFEAELLLDAEGDTPKVDAVGRRLIGLLGPVLAGLGPRGAALSKGLQALPSGRVPAAVAPLVVQGAVPRQEYLAENDQVRRAQLVETMLLTRLAESRPATAEA